MKKMVIGIIIGVLTTLSLMYIPALAEGLFNAHQKLKAAGIDLNTVNIQVNSIPVYAQTLLYEGNTYVPLRTISEMLDKNVEWDGNSNTANIVDKNFIAQAVPPQVQTPKSSSNAILNQSFNYPLGLYADDDKNTYLGKLTTNEYDKDSIWNEFGTYGSKYNKLSIWNENGTYGGKFSKYSPFNEFTTTPPIIKDSKGKTVGRLSINKFVTGAVDINELHSYLKDNGQ